MFTYEITPTTSTSAQHGAFSGSKGFGENISTVFSTPVHTYQKPYLISYLKTNCRYIDIACNSMFTRKWTRWFKSLYLHHHLVPGCLYFTVYTKTLQINFTNVYGPSLRMINLLHLELVDIGRGLGDYTTHQGSLYSVCIQKEEMIENNGKKITNVWKV